MALTDRVDVDIAIVGAGPTGLFAAYYAGFRGLSTAVIDLLPERGGQVTAMYPEKLIFDVGGFPSIRGRDLIAGLVEQAAPFEPKYLLGSQAQKFSYVDASPVLALDDGVDVHCGAVLI
nr:NAD(P)/FAD-dependent oxidoreductase [Longispora sp. (in: high G+C Gram-positive bacteria)]